MSFMHIVTAEEMRNIDRHTIDTIGIPALVLMENAGREVAREVRSLTDRRFPDRRPARWLIMVGKGNNGGDGLVAARHLAEAGIEVSVVYAEPPERLRGEAAVQRDIAARLGIETGVYRAGEIDWRAYDGIVDALLGTGTAGAPREPYASFIREANASGLPIVAVDIPSGLDADTGAAHESCIKAELTVALAFVKRGLLQYPGAEKAGEIVCASIGIPTQLADRFGVQTYILDERTLRERLGVDPALPRRADTHKGTYGHALIAAGSRRMSGAALLAAKAALRAGCGLATLAVPDCLVEPLIGRVPELMLAGVPDGGTGEWTMMGQALDVRPRANDIATEEAAQDQMQDRAVVHTARSAADDMLLWRVGAAREALAALARGKQAVLIGPGMGRFPGDAGWLKTAWEQIEGPLVLDADALNMLADAADFPAWPRRAAATVLTPHPGEMARLAGLPTAEVQRDRIGLARRYAAQHGVTLVLKGARTVVAAPNGAVYVNVNGNPGMATGGAGDVLAGIIAGLLAQGLSAEQATALGVFLHGAAGDRAAALRPSVGSLLAGDIVEML
jgi:NAD(P)H-hydrate epimerase